MIFENIMDLMNADPAKLSTVSIGQRDDEDEDDDGEEPYVPEE